mmetsp:Transcript_68131/g.153085  ORF Transcript_68131/g.153085 Transcript_68131/m.153085 type:complete len:433 (-) Transcript_68131:598-1896(-)
MLAQMCSSRPSKTSWSMASCRGTGGGSLKSPVRGSFRHASNCAPSTPADERNGRSNSPTVSATSPRRASLAPSSRASTWTPSTRKEGPRQLEGKRCKTLHRKQGVPSCSPRFAKTTGTSLQSTNWQSTCTSEITSSTLLESSHTPNNAPTCLTSAYSSSRSKRAETSDTPTCARLTPTFKRAAANFGACLAPVPRPSPSWMRSCTLTQLTSPVLPVSTTTACQPPGAGKTTWPGFLSSGTAPQLLPPPAAPAQRKVTSKRGSGPAKGQANSTVWQERASNSSASSTPLVPSTGAATGAMETAATSREKFWSSHLEPRLTVRQATPPRLATFTVNIRSPLGAGLHERRSAAGAKERANGPASSPELRVTAADHAAPPRKLRGRNCSAKDAWPAPLRASAFQRKKLIELDASTRISVRESPAARTSKVSSGSSL